MALLRKTVGRTADRALVNGAAHGAASGGQERQGVLFDQAGRKGAVSLSDNDLPIPDLYRLCAQIGRKAVFLFQQADHADHAREVKRAHRNIRYTEHQGASLEKALGPGVCAGEGMPPIPFDIAKGIAESVMLPTNENIPVNGVQHAADIVATFHKGDIAKGPHDVISDGAPRPEAQSAASIAVGHVQAECNAVFSKMIFTKIDVQVPTLLVQIPIGECDIPHTLLGDELDRAGGRRMGSVHGGNDGQCFLIRLTFKVPSAEIITHTESPFSL